MAVSIVSEQTGEKRNKPILRPYDTLGSTRYVDFDTTRTVYVTAPNKCHVNYVVADTESWEQKMAQTLESMPEVIAYVKNQNLGFTIPYTVDGNERAYTPRLHRPPRRRPRPRRFVEPHRRGLRRPTPRQRRQSRHRQDVVGGGREQPRWLREVGLRGSEGSMECGE